MGRPDDDQSGRVPPLTSPRTRVLRKVLAALAGGGLTAAGLGGQLSDGAFASTLPGGPSGGKGSTPITAPESSTGSKPTSGTTEGSSSTGSSGASTTTSTGPAAPPPSAAPPATTSGSAPASSPVPGVVGQGSQKATGSETSGPSTKRASTHAAPHAPGGATGPQGSGATGSTGATGATGPNGVAPPPALAAGQAAALAGQLAGSAASAQALAFYRVPLFLLPIYQAAAVEYGVPWQILAAINEIETNYGSDQSVSTAGAEGWMQFMPSTWLQYGVDALDAGYADPYNPVDAIFAAARYLRAAGAAQNLSGAILAYNHSQEYVDSVLLRAKLISSYPTPVIATLSGLVDGRPPVTGKRVLWGAPEPAPPASSSATANAVPVQGAPAPSSGSTDASGAKSPGAAGQPVTPPSTPPTPAAAAAAAGAKATAAGEQPELVSLMTARNAAVVAVQSGRVVGLGASRKLGRYVILRDVFGDIFTYAGLGSIAPTYTLPKPPSAPASTAVIAQAGVSDPKPSRPASAGGRSPVTLNVKPSAGQPAPAAPSGSSSGAGATGEGAGAPAASEEAAPAGMGKVRLFAHPGNPDARAAAAIRATHRHATPTPSKLPLKSGSVVAQGTVLGHVRAPAGARYGHLRFAIRLAGDPRGVDPRAILSNWSELDQALHPQGAKGEVNLIAATASDVLLLSKSQLEREVLADPGIAMSPCARREVASGAIDKRALAVLGFLSRSGLKPTVGTLPCARGAYAAAGYVTAGHAGDALAITQVNGIPIAGHQGTGSITDTTIRTLLTLQGEFVPRKIVSLMRYPGAPSTLARADHGDYLEIAFAPSPVRGRGQVPASPAHSAATGPTAPAPPALAGGELSAAEWEQLIARVAALPVPMVAAKPTSAAIADPGSTGPTGPAGPSGP